jgi:hypothetical protein
VAASDQAVDTRPRRWRIFKRRDPAMEALISEMKAAAGKLGLEFRDSRGGTMFAMCVCVCVCVCSDVWRRWYSVCEVAQCLLCVWFPVLITTHTHKHSCSRQVRRGQARDGPPARCWSWY